MCMYVCLVYIYIFGYILDIWWFRISGLGTGSGGLWVLGKQKITVGCMFSDRHWQPVVAPWPSYTDGFKVYFEGHAGFQRLLESERTVSTMQK